VMHIIPYLVVGAILWVCVLKSGVHATLAGVLTAFAIPLRGTGPTDSSPSEVLEHALHPWVAFLILPVFAFVNAGVAFDGLGLRSFVDPITLGIVTGLFVGKQVGVFLPMAVLIGMGLVKRPEGASWRQLYGLAVLCGIGFTMSLFIGSLAFEYAHFDAPIRLGVLTGSILSAAMGYALLRRSGNDTGAGRREV
jgi:Na+:H+ antiporter, NhaA family